MLQLKVEPCSQDSTETISDLLEELGALSITLTDQFDDPILEPEPGTIPLWPHVVLHAIYDADCHMDHIIDTLMTSHPELSCSVSHVQEKNWERECLRDFKPQRFGQQLWICPSWFTPPDAKAVNVVLDPGLAFGTGSHPTTGLCLTWLAEHPPQKKVVIDYGCGSGILSVAALKLGAKHVYAVDIDEQALIATKQNAEVNQIQTNMLSIEYPDTLETPADIIMANILLAPLLTLKARFEALLNPNGMLVISGILANQVDELMGVYQSAFSLVESEREGDWAMLYLKLI